jgi:hypothetical protein
MVALALAMASWEWRAVLRTIKARPSSLYHSFRQPDPEDTGWQWERTWLPFCHWGCAVYSVVDCVAPYPVFYVDPSVKDLGEPMASIIVPHKPSLAAWLEDWLAGKDLWREAWG